MNLTPEGQVQKLIDICFGLIMTATCKEWSGHFSAMNNEQKAEWVRHQLSGCGFETKPCGASWGVLIENPKL